MTEFDKINPQYYTTGKIEVIDFIEDKELPYHLGNVIKYICRAGKKTPDKLTDLNKAKWYLEKVHLSMLVAVDTETTKLSTFHGGRPFLATSYDGTTAKYFKPDQFNELKKICEDLNIEKIGQNIKFDILHLKTQDIQVVPVYHDTMIQSFLYDESTRHSLAFLAENYLNKKKLGDSVGGWLTKNGYTKKRQAEEERSFYELVPDEIMIPYALEDVKLTYELHNYFMPKLQQMGLLELYKQEMELINVLVKMQTRGVRIDIPYFIKLQKEYVSKKEQLAAKLLSKIGIADFNLNSTQQLAEWLKNSKGIILPETDKGQDSVDKHALQPHIHDEDISTLLDYRFTAKMLSTYIDPYLKLNVDGYIHADYNQIGAKTGRFSCNSPNLQTTNKPEEGDEESYIIRRGFIPSEDKVLVYFDFSNMEVVVFVDYAKDEKMIHNILNGVDFHQYNADKLGLPGKKGRKIAKTLVFSTLYGAGAAKVARILGIKTSEAEKIKRDFFNNFSSVKEFIDRATKTSIKRGYIFNKYKRRRRLGKEKSYIGVNFLVQGTCADLVKEKMIKIDKILENKNSWMIMQIHDEIVIEMDLKELHLISEIKKEMEDLAHVLDHVPMKVGVDYSTTTWADKKEWNGMEIFN